jgi:hypothetical protein
MPQPEIEHVDAKARMAECDATKSHAECVLDATDAHIAATACDDMPVMIKPGRRACMVKLYESIDESVVACIEQHEWELAECASEAACDLEMIRTCVSEDHAEDCKLRLDDAQAKALDACSKLDT